MEKDGTDKLDKKENKYWSFKRSTVINQGKITYKNNGRKGQYNSQIMCSDIIDLSEYFWRKTVPEEAGQREDIWKMHNIMIEAGRIVQNRSL